MVCLCAAWCGVCNQYQAVFDALARRHPEARFDWVDIEDEAEAMGDVDVETFPTLLVARGDAVYYLGALTPQAEVLHRLLQQFEQEGAPAKAADSDSMALWRRVREVLRDDTQRPA